MRDRVVVVLTASCLLLSGCTLFAPRFDPYVSEKTNTAYTGVAELIAAVELGKYADPASFAGAVDRYASIDGKLAAASQRATLVDAPTGASQTARDLLRRQIERCRTQVRDLADTHKELGLAPAAGATAGTMVSCDMAARAADAMKR